jgi:hypothetical protein
LQQQVHDKRGCESGVPEEQPAAMEKEHADGSEGHTEDDDRAVSIAESG